jgi:hypothetical protein
MAHIARIAKISNLPCVQKRTPKGAGAGYPLWVSRPLNAAHQFLEINTRRASRVRITAPSRDIQIPSEPVPKAAAIPVRR